MGRVGLYMNKSLLKQALKFKNEKPTNSQIKTLIQLSSEYQKENELYFLNIKHGQKPQITDKIQFFKFLSEINNLIINSFDDIEFYMKDSSSRKESIEKSGNSKEYYSKVFDKVIVYKKSRDNPILYSDINQIPIIENKQILAVENGETFLNIYQIMSKYGFEEFVYLSGFPNSLTKEFLKDKDVVFFLDYDIEAIRIYDSIKCKSKEFFKHPSIETYFDNEKYLNKELYKEQRNRLPENHNELQWLINLINKYSGVIEQEICN